MTVVRTVAQLEALYGEPVPGSITKQVDHLTPLHQEYVHTLLLPDRRGNNRLDTLRNLIADPRIGLLFLVPGVGVTLRVNGTAELSTDEQLRHRFTIGGKAPATVIVVSTTSVYTQCPKALIRSHLWEPANHRDPSELPTVGQIMEAITAGEVDGKAYDDAHPERIRQAIY